MEYELLTSMLTSKLGHRKEYFLHLLGLDCKSQKPHPTSPFLSQKLNHDFEINLHMADFYGVIPAATWNHVPWKLYYTQLGEQLVTQQLNF